MKNHFYLFHPNRFFEIFLFFVAGIKHLDFVQVFVYFCLPLLKKDVIAIKLLQSFFKYLLL